MLYLGHATSLILGSAVTLVLLAWLSAIASEHPSAPFAFQPLHTEQMFLQRSAASPRSFSCVVTIHLKFSHVREELEILLCATLLFITRISSVAVLLWISFQPELHDMDLAVLNVHLSYGRLLSVS